MINRKINGKAVMFIGLVFFLLALLFLPA